MPGFDFNSYLSIYGGTNPDYLYNEDGSLNTGGKPSMGQIMEPTDYARNWSQKQLNKQSMNYAIPAGNMQLPLSIVQGSFPKNLPWLTTKRSFLDSVGNAAKKASRAVKKVADGAADLVKQKAEQKKVAEAERIAKEEEESRRNLDNANQKYNDFVANPKAFGIEKDSPEYQQKLNEIQAEVDEARASMKMGGGERLRDKAKTAFKNATGALAEGATPDGAVQAIGNVAAKGLMDTQDPISSYTRDVADQTAKSGAEQAGLAKQQIGKAIKDYKTTADENAMAGSAFKASAVKQQLGVGAGAGAAALAGAQAAAQVNPEYTQQQQISNQLMQQGMQNLEQGRALQRDATSQYGNAAAADYTAGQTELQNMEADRLSLGKQQREDEMYNFNKKWREALYDRLYGGEE